MKRCPECGSTYTDRIDFCFHEGAALVGATVDAADTLAPDDESGFDLPGVSLPETPRDTPANRSDPTPRPLARMHLPPTLLDAPRSPLAAPPPPPRHSTPVEPTDPAIEPSTPDQDGDEETSLPQAGQVPLTEAPATPVSAARSGPPPAPLDPLQAASPPPPRQRAVDDAAPPVQQADQHVGSAPDDEPHAAGVPSWAWLVGGITGVVLIGGAVLFALGGLGMLGAAATRVAGQRDGRDGPPLDVGQPAASAAPVDDVMEEPDRVEPLQLGVLETDSDAQGTAEPLIDTDAAPGDDPAEASDTSEPVPVGVDGGLSAGGSSEPQSTPAPIEPDQTPVVAAPAVEPDPPAAPQGTPEPPVEPAGDDQAASPWGDMPDEPTPSPPPADAIAVQVTMDGGGEGLKLYVDGTLQPGPFPHALRLAPGTHFFKVVDGAGKQYEIGKPIRKGSNGGMSLQLFPP